MDIFADPDPRPSPRVPAPQSWSNAPWWRRAIWATKWAVRRDTSWANTRRTYRRFRDQILEHIVHLITSLICVPLGLILALTWPLTIVPWRIFCAVVWPREHEKAMKLMGEWPEQKSGGGQ